jgi:hypothetical protein
MRKLTLTATKHNGIHKLFIVDNLYMTTNSYQMLLDGIEELKRLLHPNEIIREW